jgi:hypothetical protein
LAVQGISGGLGRAPKMLKGPVKRKMFLQKECVSNVAFKAQIFGEGRDGIKGTSKR